MMMTVLPLIEGAAIHGLLCGLVVVVLWLWLCFAFMLLNERYCSDNSESSAVKSATNHLDFHVRQIAVPSQLC